MAFDNAIKAALETVLGPIAPNYNINKALTTVGVTAENAYDVWWALQIRFDTGIQPEDVDPNMKIKDAFALWKADFALDPVNNPEVE
jgi:hypothetical protein